MLYGPNSLIFEQSRHYSMLVDRKRKLPCANAPWLLAGTKDPGNTERMRLKLER